MKKKTQIRSITAACAVIIVCSAVIVNGFISLVYKPQLTYKPQNQQTPLTEEQLSGDVKTIELMGKTYTATLTKTEYLDLRDVTLYDYTDGNGNLFTFSNRSEQLVDFILKNDNNSSRSESDEQFTEHAKVAARTFLTQFVDLDRYSETMNVWDSGTSIKISCVQIVDNCFYTGDYVDVYMDNNFTVYGMSALEVGRYDNLQMPDSIDQQVIDAIAAAVSEARGSDAVIDRYAYKNGFLNVLLESDHQYHIHGDVDVWLKDAQAEGGVKAEPVRVEIDFPFQPAAV